MRKRVARHLRRTARLLGRVGDRLDPPRYTIKGEKGPGMFIPIVEGWKPGDPLPPEPFAIRIHASKRQH